MSLDLFERVVSQVAPMTEQIAFHLMGDPLLHPHLDELVQICERHRARIFFVTNGVLLREASSRLLLSPAFRQVNFSLHSFHDNYGDRDPSEYLERIFAFSERALVERPDLYINYRLWNLQEVRGGTSLNRDMLYRVTSRFGAEPPQEIDVRRKKSFPLKGRVYLHFDTEFVWPDLTLPLLGEHGRCYGLSSHFGILADGTVVPCCLDKEGTIPLGHIDEKPITEILADPRAQAIIKGFQAGKLIEPLCQRCNFIKRFQVP